MNIDELLKEAEASILAKVEDMIPEEQKVSDEEMQRTERWHLERLGRFTGSQMKNIMSLPQSPRPSAKNPLDWGESKWLFAFGKMALSYITLTAIHRATGKSRTIEGLPQFEHGEKTEPEAIASVSELLNIKVQEMPFTPFEGMPWAGSSPDGKTNIEHEDLAAEVKCPDLVKHETYMNSQVAYKHDYFWQVESEMLSCETNKALFVSYNADFPEDCRVHHEIVNSSELHREALKFRCVVGEILVRSKIEGRFKVDTAHELELLKEDCGEQNPFVWAEGWRKHLNKTPNAGFELINEKLAAL